jgi:hypothetical protein
MHRRLAGFTGYERHQADAGRHEVPGQARKDRRVGLAPPDQSGEGRSNGLEFGRHFGSNSGQRADDDNADETSDQPVLNRGNTRIVLRKSCKNAFHFVLSHSYNLGMPQILYSLLLPIY